MSPQKLYEEERRNNYQVKQSMLLNDFFAQSTYGISNLKAVHKPTHGGKQSIDLFIGELKKRIIYFSKLQYLKTFEHNQNPRSKKFAVGNFPYQSIHSPQYKKLSHTQINKDIASRSAYLKRTYKPQILTKT